ncbi:hypothetical protein CI109_101184 [Kwoniella shandongensis]|uniref:Uncharacterized protein n=1 Tax=Kwoniella shandongensis TaxID=1734106 RepID=A0A5M6BZ23_9TREE|nr:uncharacterized protein CI109_005498 [Kwoniella shandongensis]KAA5526219.1 hypothetical protein CI109_005498 [Kwoniella shandongensis]
MSQSKSRRHIPYLPFHKQLIRQICRPQEDDLLILAKGLGLRRIVCALLKTYDRKEDLVLVVGATPADEAGIGDELGIMGVRDPGFRVVGYEMSVKEREEMYRHGGLFSVTSKILVNDFLKGTVPAKLITGLVILHAERVSHGSQEEFAVRLYRRENQSGFCKAFSDEPEMFSHGISPMKDMLVNLNMTSVLIWPRFNEAVKTDLASRRADVVEMYQPMTDLMRSCQDAITECMEAMLVELKRDHSLNLDLEDLNVRNAQFKNFDTMVRMKLKPVWHKVGVKTKIHVAALTELRNLHTWLLEYDSATFASYINTLQRQHFQAEKLPSGPGRHVHDWFNARSASRLVEASQSRVSQRSLTMDNEHDDSERSEREETGVEEGVDRPEGEFGDEEEAVREAEREQSARPVPVDEEEDEIMEVFATQTQTVSQARRGVEDEDEGEEMRELGEDGADGEESLREATGDAPPVFRPVMVGMEDNLTSSVKKRMRKSHEAVLEEQPKWSLLAKVLKEIEDTIARVAETHADTPGTNIVLVMTSSDRTCLQLRQYLTTMQKTDPTFGAHAGKKMMETLFLSNWQHEKNGERLSDPNRMQQSNGGDEVRVKKGEMESKRMEDANRRGRGKGVPTYKRRRQRGGANFAAPRVADLERDHKETLMKAQSAFAGGEDGMEDPQMQWALSESSRGAGPSNGVSSSTAVSDPSSALLARSGVVEEDDLDPLTSSLYFSGSDSRDTGYDGYGRLMPENFEDEYGLIAPEDAVIIRPYGGEDDDILLQELRPRFVVMYEPNLAFIRRLEVYRNSNPGLSLRVYQMIYTNSFEEDRFLSTITREAEAFKKLIEDRQSMVIPIYNNNPRAPMRDNVTRSKTTYSSRNAGGGETAEESRIIVDIREMGALLPSLIDAAGIKVVPSTLTVGDYILSPKMCVERKALPDLEASFANGRLHTQCESMTAHYETCILLIEFEEDKFGLRTREDARREVAGRNTEVDESWRDTFYLQSKLVLLTLHFPRLRIIWSSSPHESVRILSDLKLNHDEPDEMVATLKGSTEGEASFRSGIENAAAVEMLRALPGVSGRNLKFVMSKVESIKELVGMKKKEIKEVLGEEGGDKAWGFIHHDSRKRR